MKKKIIVGSLILVVAISAGGFWFVNNQERESDKVAINQKDNQGNVIVRDDKQDQKESEIEQIDTSNWQTYRNEEYGFEFKYPMDWITKEGRNANTYLFDGLTVKVYPKKVDEYNEDLFFNVSVFKSNSSSKKWYQTKYENPDAIKDYKGETKELKINNLDAYYVVEDKGEYKQNTYVLSKNNILIYPTFRSERNYNGNEADFSYDEYLSHFKSLVYSIK